MKTELIGVELEGPRRAIAWIAHDPYASYSRAVRPFATRNRAVIAHRAGDEFARAAARRGWLYAGLRHERPALEDGRAVTGYVLEVA